MLNNPKNVQFELAGQTVTLETGTMAKQANGSVLLKCGKMVLLATTVMSKSPKVGIDFFPLTVEYMEKMYASGKIPGGFFKREARPTTTATLTARLIDRPLRPSFPKGLFNEVQVVITVLSYDDTISPEPFSIFAASAALSVSDIPFNGPVGSVLVGHCDGNFIVNPTTEQLLTSDLQIVVAGTAEAILMVEAGGEEVSEETVLKAIAVGHDAIKICCEAQLALVEKAGKTKLPTPVVEINEALNTQITEFIGDKIATNLQSSDKDGVDSFLSELQASVVENFVDEDDSNKSEVLGLYNTLKKQQIRKTIIQKKVRPDGRKLDEVRPIEIELGVLPNAHGSALFTRGETQSLGVVTLGTTDDGQLQDGLDDKTTKYYYFHYNFPPYSVGECGWVGRTGRRELGHGALAERAVKGILPQDDTFPYTVRIVSEILESNGSSSMASVCSGSLSLMDCGVPVSSGVSGIAMGLLIDGQDYVVLSDIQGLEDHYGDMDFKVAGTKKGINALQLDIKVAGLSEEILRNALSQAKAGRLHILDVMNQSISTPRDTISPNAPKIESFHIDPNKVGMVIGSGGKMIRQIEEESGASVSIADGDSGEIHVHGKSAAQVDAAKNYILNLLREVEPGEEFDGKVIKITNFGAFVELLPGKEGLLHISKISDKRIERVEDVLEVGQIIAVKVREIDNMKRISLVANQVLA